MRVICTDRKYFGKLFHKFLGRVIPGLLMNLLTFHGFTKDINWTVVKKCPSWMLEYYFSKVFVVFGMQFK